LGQRGDAGDQQQGNKGTRNPHKRIVF
jgi:hypothetical protein